MLAITWSSSKLLVVQDIQEQIGTKVRKLRLKHGLTQNVFADRSGLNRARTLARSNAVRATSPFKHSRS